MTETATGAESLARAVLGRRQYLDLRQGDIEINGGPSIAVVRVIESAGRDRPQRKTFNGLDQALDWPEGAAKSVFADAKPYPGSQAADVSAYVEELIYGDFRPSSDPTLHAEREITRKVSDAALVLELAKRLRVDLTALVTNDAPATD
ncbi:MAG TPA: hypothetical protein VG317_22105 [Pseudonocardiaceae bacterium]|nr:hypothetical protein [Pseudonocardiaceae bacterium]